MYEDQTVKKKVRPEVFIVIQDSIVSNNSSDIFFDKSV